MELDSASTLILFRWHWVLAQSRVKFGGVSIIFAFWDCGPTRKDKSSAHTANTAPRCWWMTAINKLIWNNYYAPSCFLKHLIGQINWLFDCPVYHSCLFSANYDGYFFSFNVTVPAENSDNMYTTLSRLYWSSKMKLIDRLRFVTFIVKLGKGSYQLCLVGNVFT